MPMTISFQNGSNYCFKHNSRDAQFCAKEPHIDLSKPHEIWHQEKLGEAYKNLFGEAVKTYNEKQKRTDRKLYQLASGAVHALHKWRNMSADDLEERAQAYRDVGAKNGFEYNDIVIKKEEQERAQEALNQPVKRFQAQRTVN